MYLNRFRQHINLLVSFQDACHITHELKLVIWMKITGYKNTLSLGRYRVRTIIICLLAFITCCIVELYFQHPVLSCSGNIGINDEEMRRPLPTLEEAISLADAIFLAKIHDYQRMDETRSEKLILNVKQVFKGSPPSQVAIHYSMDDDICASLDRKTFGDEVGSEYIYLAKIKASGEYILPRTFPKVYKPSNVTSESNNYYQEIYYRALKALSAEEPK